jgi:hypothetical protein
MPTASFADKKQKNFLFIRPRNPQSVAQSEHPKLVRLQVDLSCSKVLIPIGGQRTYQRLFRSLFVSMYELFHAPSNQSTLYNFCITCLPWRAVTADVYGSPDCLATGKLINYTPSVFSQGKV